LRKLGVKLKKLGADLKEEEKKEELLVHLRKIRRKKKKKNRPLLFGNGLFLMLFL